MSGRASSLDLAGPAVALAVIEGVYRDEPFWTARFGDHGRRHADRDAAYHIDYLRSALEASDPGVLTRYATWLRTVLVSRGMCSRHLADTFRRLADGLVRAQLDDAPRAASYLAAARDALTYREGPAAALEPVPDDLTSFFADSVAAGRPALFEAHVRWARGAFPTETAAAEAALTARCPAPLRGALAAALAS